VTRNPSTRFAAVWFKDLVFQIVIHFVKSAVHLIIYVHSSAPLKDQLVNAIIERVAVYSEKHMKPTNTFCVQNADIYNAETGGSYN
jgi:hypothetical protein